MIGSILFYRSPELVADRWSIPTFGDNEQSNELPLRLCCQPGEPRKDRNLRVLGIMFRKTLGMQHT